MKKQLLTLVAMLFVGLVSAFAQSGNDSIIIEKAFLGHKFIYNDQVVTSIGTMKTIVGNNEMALKEVKKADVVNNIATVLACVGGAVAGWQLGSVVAGGDFNTYVFAGGLGVAAVGIGLSALVDSHLTKGATIYNSSLGATSYGDPVELDFGLVPGGVGLTLSF